MMCVSLLAVQLQQSGDWKFGWHVQLPSSSHSTVLPAHGLRMHSGSQPHAGRLGSALKQTVFATVNVTKTNIFTTVLPSIPL